MYGKTNIEICARRNSRSPPYGICASTDDSQMCQKYQIIH